MFSLLFLSYARKSDYQNYRSCSVFVLSNDCLALFIFTEGMQSQKLFVKKDVKLGKPLFEAIY